MESPASGCLMVTPRHVVGQTCFCRLPVVCLKRPLQFLHRSCANIAFLNGRCAAYLHVRVLVFLPQNSLRWATPHPRQTGQGNSQSSQRVHAVPSMRPLFFRQSALSQIHISRNPEKSFANSWLDASICLRQPVFMEFAKSLRYQKAHCHG